MCSSDFELLSWAGSGISCFQAGPDPFFEKPPTRVVELRPLATVYLGCNTRARELVARGQFASVESHQVRGAGGKHLRTQFTSDSPYGFLVLFLTLASPVLAGLAVTAPMRA
jgi:hypothetical protein